MSQRLKNILTGRAVLRRIGQLVLRIVLVGLLLAVGLGIGIGLRKVIGEMGKKPTEAAKGVTAAESGAKSPSGNRR